MSRDGSSRGRATSNWIMYLILVLGLTSCQMGGPVQPSTPPPASPADSVNGNGGEIQPQGTPVNVHHPSPAPTEVAVENGDQATAVATSIATATASSPPTPTTEPGSPTPTSDQTVPSFDHIYVLMLENKESTDVVGSDSAPYLNSLIKQYGLAADYTGVAHPSQPNYLAIWAGSTFGITDDGAHDLSGQTLGDQLESAGKTWGVYEENYPVGNGAGNAACYSDASASGGEDGSGSYTRKHDPAMSFVEVNQDPARCQAHITDLSHFSAPETDFSMIVPNACHDMHDCPVSTGDSWLSTWLPEHILNTETWRETNSALFITWDEGDTNVGGGGTVPMIVISHQTPVGFRSPVTHDHYSLLATIEDSWQLGCLRQACDASNLAEFFNNR